MKKAKRIAALCLLAGARLAAADTAADANYTDIIDPVKLSAMSEAVLAATTFDGDSAPPGAVLTDGLVAFFRRPESPYESASFRLRGLDEGADYAFNSIFDEDPFTRTGADAMSAFPITMKAMPDVSIYV